MPTTPVFTSTDLDGLGWTRAARRHAIRTQRVHRIRHGVYSCAPPSQRVSVLAAARAYPHASVSHCSALLLAELPVVGARITLPELTVPPRSSVTMPDVHPYRAGLAPDERTVIDGAAVTTVARTLVDVGRDYPLITAVAAMDAALHRGVVTPADMDNVLFVCRNWPGIRKAEHARTLSDSKAESPLESVSRVTFGRLGLPAPNLQVDICDEFGVFLGRSDFYWDDLGVVGEADGLTKYHGSPDGRPLIAEKLRQEAIERTGLVVARWGWDEAWRQPSELRNRIHAAFERARARDQAGLPRAWVARVGG